MMVKEEAWLNLLPKLAELRGTLWTAHERRLLARPRSAFEGKGERSLRSRLGIAQQTTQGSHDLPDGGEVKFVELDRAPTIRISAVGKRAYGRAARALVRNLPDEAFDEATWDCVSAGELCASKLQAPAMEALRRSLAPELVMSSYTSLYMAFEQGFVNVPQADFEHAWTLLRVSQGDPRYALRRDYVVDRIHGAPLVPKGL